MVGIVSIDKRPLISIITVVLNGAGTLEKAFESVFSQQFTDYEYIVIDGASSDATIEIIEKYDRRIDYWQSEPDNGVYDAMNKALHHVNGQWVYFLGSDDHLLCDFSEVAKYLENRQTIYYGDVFRPVVNRRYDGHFSAYKLASRNICHQAIFYPVNVFSKYMFNLRYKVLADYELNMRCWHDKGFEFCYFPVVVAMFDDETGLSPTRSDFVFTGDRSKLLRAYFPFSIYLLALFRFMVIDVLAYLHMDKRVLAGYHFFLRQYRGNNDEKS